MDAVADWVPEGIDLERPSAARLYDYLLGGAHNFAHDRELAERFIKAQPNAREIARHNRSFLRRSVLFMIERGVRQFLDLGSGIPTVGNVHEIAQQADPTTRVVYVDYEEVAYAHSTLMLADNPLATIVQADLTRPRDILDAETTRELLDFTEPIGLLMAGVFHFVPPAKDPRRIVAEYRDALVPGSYLSFSQFTRDLMPAEMDRVVEVMKSSRDPMYPRSHAEITELFDGFEVVEPGIVPTALWQPDPDLDDGGEPNRAGIYAGVGRKI
ncbi:SAM-dependent methyltransferase [Actinokineospora auranticolor]|uniref:S-adenosyl methyltransferase n=1 Tax=Actinokineospora auranticolor TaxID=155976 RepID=A0A2S6GBM3_9PSEU|nr:SAM-dependent methyltransferase [Actinokineospora auranticolor]PPK61333.1 S-adenosyl methyltransferase [Actinokineospora auranticolor]